MKNLYNDVYVKFVSEGYKNETVLNNSINKLFEEYIFDHYQEGLESFFRKNNKVILKPNFVNDFNLNTETHTFSDEDMMNCFITNIKVIKAILKMLSGIDNIQVKIIESPIQFCNISKIITSQVWDDLKSEFNGMLDFIDLRRTIASFDKGKLVSKGNMRALDNYIDFNLGDDSLLEPCKSSYHKFRVTDYPPKAMLNFHSPGIHKYRVCSEVFDADIVINIPKLKTHEKAGFTGAMKNFIGTVGNKECLPHHMKGCPATQGDCYKKISMLKIIAEFFKDYANSYILKHNQLYQMINYIPRICIKLLSITGKDCNITGAWSGNDTIWRTVIDINRIIYYGAIDGKIDRNIQRNIFTLTDAIISGQNDGPLKPVPLYTNALTLGNSTGSVDIVNCILLGFPVASIPQVNNLSADMKYPIIRGKKKETVVKIGTKVMSLKEFKQIIPYRAVPATGWTDIIGHIDKESYDI